MGQQRKITADPTEFIYLISNSYSSTQEKKKKKKKKKRKKNNKRKHMHTEITIKPE